MSTSRTGSSSAEQAGASQRILCNTLTSASWWVLFATITLSPLVVVKGLSDFADLPQAAIVQTGALLSFLLLVLAGACAGQLHLTVPRVAYPLVAFLLWALLSLSWSTNVYEGMTTWRGWAAAFLIFLLVVWQVSADRQRARWLVGGLFLTGSLVGGIGAAQHLFSLTSIPQVVPPAATFANKNMAVHFLILTLPLALVFLLGAHRRAVLWGSAVLWMLMVTYLCFTKTRAGWVAFGAECVVFAFVALRAGVFRRRERRREGAAALLVALAGVLVAVNLGPDGFHWRLGAVFDRAASIFTDFLGSPVTGTIAAEKQAGAKPVSAGVPRRHHTSVDVRLEVWMNTLEMVRDRPLIGVGLGNHKINYPHYVSRRVSEKAFTEATQLVNVHNDYLQIWAELGTLGMVFLCWTLASCFMWFMRLSKERADDEWRLILLAIGVALSGVLVNAFFCFPFHRAIPPVITMAYLGIAATLSTHVRASASPSDPNSASHLNRPPATASDRDSTSFSVSKPVLAGLAVCLLVGTTTLCWYSYRIIEADRSYLVMTQRESASDWKGVLAAGHEVLRLDPLRKQTFSSMGRAYVEMGQQQMGVDALQKVVASYPYHMNALLNIGVAYAGLKRYDEAIEAYKRVIAIKDDYAKVHYNLGTIYLERRDYDRALTEFLTAARIEPANAGAHYGAGLAFGQVGRLEEGFRQLRIALDLDPTLPGHDRIQSMWKASPGRESNGER